MTERIVSSADISAEPIALGQEAGKLGLYGGLETPFSSDVIELSPVHVRQIEAYAAQAASNFMPLDADTPEPTFAQQELGVPSLIVRIDCTVVDNKIVAYEMEDSPSGQGISHRVHRQLGGAGIRDTIRGHYEKHIGAVPHVIVAGARNHGTDDHLIVGERNYTYDTDTTIAVPDDAFVIIKAIPGDPRSAKPYLHLQQRTLAPLVSEGDKTYQERIGDLTRVQTPMDLLRRDTDNELASQALKARIGSMAMGICMYLHPDDRKTHGKKGIVTASRLENTIDTFTQAKNGALTQPFAPPIRLENPEGRSNAIMRVFTLLERKGGTIHATAIGGGYVARPELIVHGASNAVLGAVTVPEGLAA
ncbi:hypothetical protein PV379_01115 [Streptomyces caniscabiei]|uniref:hypothetical protein n=1 Tax=Streptomyces caniscabiei TaxID=2746961 RepID=UPI00299FD8C9|nr:hypothetical protein [Streptomyces caniscabiei]MDX2775956.1 hypothetical protein [Streptomyces caniscabiei]